MARSSDACDPTTDHIAASTRHAASGIQLSVQRRIHVVSRSRFGTVSAGTSPERTIVPTNVPMRGFTHASHTKNAGMATSRRTCAGRTSSESSRVPAPPTSASTTSTPQVPSPSASPSGAELEAPRTRPRRRPIRCSGPPSSDSRWSASGCSIRNRSPRPPNRGDIVCTSGAPTPGTLTRDCSLRPAFGRDRASDSGHRTKGCPRERRA
jgi:hypothetical protein